MTWELLALVAAGASTMGWAGGWMWARMGREVPPLVPVVQPIPETWVVIDGRWLWIKSVDSSVDLYPRRRSSRGVRYELEAFRRVALRPQNELDHAARRAA